MKVLRQSRCNTKLIGALGAATLGLILGGCATTQGHYVLLGSALPPIPDSQPVQVFMGTRPQSPFTKVCHLDAHLEKTGFMRSTLIEALPVLKQQARLCGADAIIDIEQQQSSVVETRVLNVTGVGIRLEPEEGGGGH